MRTHKTYHAQSWAGGFQKNLYLLDCWSITFTGWSTSCRPTKGTEGKLRQYNTPQWKVPDVSLWSSRTKASLKLGSQAHGTGWEWNRWPRKWMWTVSEESTSLSFRCSRNARPPLTCRNRCLRVGSMFAENKIKVLSHLERPFPSVLRLWITFRQNFTAYSVLFFNF